MRRALVLVALLMIPACSRALVEPELFEQPDLSGSVRIPLATSRADGTTYLLRNATLEISGSAMLTLATEPSESPARADALTTPLPAGSYTLFLRPGYQLIEVDPSGATRTLDAQLSGSNPAHFSVRDFEDATLKLAFHPAGTDPHDTIVFGAPQAVRVTRAF